MKRTAKVIAAFVALSAMLWVVLVFFSSSESRWECLGKLTIIRNPEPATAFMKLEDYRWWVGLWSDSDGMAWIEIPGVANDVYTDVRWNGHNLLLKSGLYEGFGGNFSTLSNALSLQFPGGVFDGLCKPQD